MVHFTFYLTLLNYLLRRHGSYIVTQISARVSLTRRSVFASIVPGLCRRFPKIRQQSSVQRLFHSYDITSTCLIRVVPQSFDVRYRMNIGLLAARPCGGYCASSIRRSRSQRRRPSNPFPITPPIFVPIHPLMPVPRHWKSQSVRGSERYEWAINPGRTVNCASEINKKSLHMKKVVEGIEYLGEDMLI